MTGSPIKTSRVHWIDTNLTSPCETEAPADGYSSDPAEVTCLPCAVACFGVVLGAAPAGPS